jgi:hypothetical protein
MKMKAKVKEPLIPLKDLEKLYTAEATPADAKVEPDSLLAVLERIAVALEDVHGPLDRIADALTDEGAEGSDKTLFGALLAIARHTSYIGS